MLQAQVIGHATATVKHPTLDGWRMLIVQPLDIQGHTDGEPLIALDQIGGRRGDRVMLTSDGQTVREVMQSNQTPIRWIVLGILDS